MAEFSSGGATGPAPPASDDPATVEVDGRTLAYAEYGDPGGTPVFAFHGVLGSRLTGALFDDAATEAGVRVVAPERPGFGHSDFQPGRRLGDWPADVRALAAHLGVDRFGLVGFSAGGPHAVACVAAFPGRVRGVALASSVTPPATRDRADPFNRAFLSATRLVPGFSRSAFETGAWLAASSPSGFRASLVASAAAPDRALFRNAVGDHLVADGVEAFRQGARGPAHDLPLVGGDWAVDLADLDRHFDLFHGRADATVGVDQGRAFGDLLSACDLHLSDDAHYSTLVHNRAAILEAAAGE